MHELAKKIAVKWWKTPEVSDDTYVKLLHEEIIAWLSEKAKEISKHEDGEIDPFFLLVVKEKLGIRGNGEKVRFSPVDAPAPLNPISQETKFSDEGKCVLSAKDAEDFAKQHLPDERKEWCEHVYWKEGEWRWKDDHFKAEWAFNEEYAFCPKCAAPRPKEKKAVRLAWIMQKTWDNLPDNCYEPAAWFKVEAAALQAFREVVNSMPNCDCDNIRCQEGCLNKYNLLCRLDEMGAE